MKVNAITSAEFRKTYPRLEEAVAVTANGHEIGIWIPIAHIEAGMVRAETAALQRRGIDTNALPAPDPAEPRIITRVRAQAERDAILRKINRGG